jgi:hypothetical protein
MLLFCNGLTRLPHDLTRDCFVIAQIAQRTYDGVKLSKFTEWCVETETPVTTNTLRLLKAVPSKQGHAIAVMAAALPEYYASPNRISDLLTKLGKPAAAKYVAEKLPSKLTVMSGDLGEILCNAYVVEGTVFNRGIKRLRWKDHRNMSMRGEDVLAFRLGPKGGLHILKAEVKSLSAMTTKTIEEARGALAANQELPSPHAMLFVADQLDDAGESDLRDALYKALLVDGVRTSQVTHMIFTFSQSNPSNLLTKNLTAYAGTVPQRYVALQVNGHQAFIKSVFKAVGK